MTLYCDAHGAVEVAGPPPGAKLPACPQCHTILKATPEELVRRGLPATIQLNPTANTREAGVLMRQGAFLSAYQKTGRINKAAVMAEVDRTTHYEWLRDPDYSRAFEQAKLLAFQNLADEAWRRAMGEDGATVSDRLMIKLLESLGPVAGHPEYGIRSTHELTTAPGKPLELNVSPSEQLLSRIAGLVTGSSETPGT